MGRESSLNDNQVNSPPPPFKKKSQVIFLRNSVRSHKEGCYIVVLTMAKLWIKDSGEERDEEKEKLLKRRRVYFFDKIGLLRWDFIFLRSLTSTIVDINPPPSSPAISSDECEEDDCVLCHDHYFYCISSVVESRKLFLPFRSNSNPYFLVPVVLKLCPLFMPLAPR